MIKAETIEKYARVTKRIKDGATVEEACQAEGRSASGYRQFLNSQKNDKTQVVIHEATGYMTPKVKQSRTYKPRNPGLGDFVIITTSANLASVLGNLR